VEVVNALDHAGVHIPPRAKNVVGVNPLDHKNAAVQDDLAGHFGSEFAARCFDSSRLQRAPEGAGQSPAGRRNDVIERRRVRRILVRIHAVVIGDLGVDTEVMGSFLPGTTASRTGPPFRVMATLETYTTSSTEPPSCSGLPGQQ
jgi:hypothetical protein